MRNCVLVFAAVLFSCVGVKHRMTTTRVSISQMISEKETIVLVSSANKDKITEAMQEAFEKNYKGKYEFVVDKYPRGSRYDTAKYRYVFYISYHENPGQWIGRERFPPTTDYKFGLIDRVTGMSWDQEFWSGNYKKGAANYVKHLEELRKQNAGQ
ncbi:MAG: hypothetical protein IPP72_16405 [Chitinophagaceae bacterium]|nr:hypothetical protein [Chitinophagaceae bacterium]